MNDGLKAGLSKMDSATILGILGSMDVVDRRETAVYCVEQGLVEPSHFVQVVDMVEGEYFVTQAIIARKTIGKDHMARLLGQAGGDPETLTRLQDAAKPTTRQMIAVLDVYLTCDEKRLLPDFGRVIMTDLTDVEVWFGTADKIKAYFDENRMAAAMSRASFDQAKRIAAKYPQYSGVALQRMADTVSNPVTDEGRSDLLVVARTVLARRLDLGKALGKLSGLSFGEAESLLGKLPKSDDSSVGVANAAEVIAQVSADNLAKVRLIAGLPKAVCLPVAGAMVLRLASSLDEAVTSEFLGILRKAELTDSTAVIIDKIASRLAGNCQSAVQAVEIADQIPRPDVIMAAAHNPQLSASTIIRLPFAQAIASSGGRGWDKLPKIGLAQVFEAIAASVSSSPDGDRMANALAIIKHRKLICTDEAVPDYHIQAVARAITDFRLAVNGPSLGLIDSIVK